MKRLLVVKLEQEMFSNSSSAYGVINNSEEKRYDTDPYAIRIYQHHIHPLDISQPPVEGG